MGAAVCSSEQTGVIVPKFGDVFNMCIQQVVKAMKGGVEQGREGTRRYLFAETCGYHDNAKSSGWVGG